MDNKASKARVIQGNRIPHRRTPRRRAIPRVRAALKTSPVRNRRASEIMASPQTLHRGNQAIKESSKHLAGCIRQPMQ